MTRRRKFLDFSTNVPVLIAVGLVCGGARAAEARPERPNVVVIFAADVGPWDLGAYHAGLGSGVTPQLDRLAHEGARFSDAYGHAGSAAARAAFLTGQAPVRTGVTRDLGPGPPLAAEDPTLAELLRAEGYTTAHFGPSLLGEANDALPTARGFDVFRGPLALPGEADAAGRRGVLDCRAAEFDPSAAPDPRFGPPGPQRCADTGPLAPERLPELERESLAAALAFLEAAVAAGRPFFVWHNTARVSAPSRLAPEWRGRSGQGAFADGLLELDAVVGALVARLDALDVADSTLLVFTSDRGPRAARWPDAGATPFRDGAPGFEAAVRVPLVVRWPGRIQPGSVVPDLFAHEDWLPTLLAAAGRPDLPARLREGVALGGRSLRAHLDGHDQLPLLLGAAPGARRAWFHFADDGALAAVRAGDWKLLLAAPAAPLLLNLRLDPLERAPSTPGFAAWHEEQRRMLEPIAAYTEEFLATFDAFPPRRPSPGFDRAALRARLAALAAPAAQDGAR